MENSERVFVMNKRDFEMFFEDERSPMTLLELLEIIKAEAELNTEVLSKPKNITKWKRLLRSTKIMMENIEDLKSLVI